MFAVEASYSASVIYCNIVPVKIVYWDILPAYLYRASVYIENTKFLPIIITENFSFKQTVKH